MLEMLAADKGKADRDKDAASTWHSPGNVRDILAAGGTPSYMMPPRAEEPQQRQTLRAAVQKKTHAAYERVRMDFYSVPDACTPPEKISTKLYALLIKKEQALAELWFGGQGSGFLPLLFPIMVEKKNGNGTEEIGGWGQAEKVPTSQRHAVLKGIRLRRHAAILRHEDMVKAMTDSLADEDAATRGRAADAYTQALQNDDSLTDETKWDDLTSWITEQQAYRANMYYMSLEDISAIREQYPLDISVQNALLTVQEVSVEEPTDSETGIVPPNIPTTGLRSRSVGTHDAPPARKSLRIPAAPSVINSAWATEFYNEYDLAARNNWFIPPVLLTTECDRGIQVLLEAQKDVPIGVPWSTRMDFQTMLRKVMDSQKGNIAQQPRTAIQKICELQMVLDRHSIQNPAGPLAMVQAVEKILTPYNPQPGCLIGLPADEEATAVQHFKDILDDKKGPDKFFYKEVSKDVFNTEPPKQVRSLLQKLTTVVLDINRCHEKVQACAPSDLQGKRKHEDSFRSEGKAGIVKPKGGNQPNTYHEGEKPCDKCGRSLKDEHHVRGHECPYAKHPNANKAGGSWAASAQGKALKNAKWGKVPPRKKMLPDGTFIALTDSELDTIYGQHSAVLKAIKENTTRYQSGAPAKKVSDIFTRNSISYLDGTNSFNPHVFGRAANNTEIGEGILDSGSFGYIANYISFDAFQRLAKLGLATTHKCKEARVCSLSSCFMNNECTTFQLELYSTSVQRNIIIPFTARIVKGLPYEFIIGLPSVRRHKLTRVFDYIFEDSEIISEGDKRKREISESRADTPRYHRQWKRPHAPVQTDPIPSGSAHISVSLGAQGDEHHCDSCGDQSRLYCIQCSSQRTYSSACTVETISGPYRTDAPAATAPLDSEFLNSIRARHALLREKLRADARNVLMPIVHRDALLDQEDDTDYLDDYLDESPHDLLLNNDKVVEQGLDKMTIQGTEEFKTDYSELMTEFITRFKSNLTPIAAYLEPFRLELTKDSTWFSSAKHQLAPRQVTRAKESAIDSFIEKALAQDLIEESQASSWSQPHLTPKTNGDWRFCIDYRYLNENCKSLGWPLPNIRQMLERIGAQKPKFFAVLDLTEGYYQTAISVESRPLTAFRTSKGLYQWKRLPMGLKGAPAYFQHAMQSTVLGGLLQSICEVYLDDIIVYAQSEQELLQNLRQVFGRLEQYNITLNPAKVRVGLTSVEYVGHRIDSEGLSFSEEKREDVWKTPLPTTKRSLKQFLGLCVQFKDHVRNYSTLVAPLHALLPNYSKKDANQPVLWTEETRKTFVETQKAVNECPKLFFLHPSAPVYLHTDASNYGIGGYLFQIIDGVETPIMFLSKGLNKTERKWSVYEKEGYAIFYSFMKMEHLLRDSKFLLRTDHQNLTFINTDLRDKVKRWKLAIQHFDFDVEHIKGELNIQADGFSRLIETPDGEPKEIVVQNAINAMRSNPPKLETLPHDIYNKIKKFHNATIGHHGIERTLQKLSVAHQSWEGMRKDVKLFIDRCPCCQKMSVIKPLIHTMPFTLASYSPFDRICVDTIGPLPIDSDSDSEYILVIIDAFSRFVKLYPVKDTSAKAALNSLLDWVGMFGIPAEMVSDNGTQFANELVEQFLEIIATTDAKIHAYSSEENGMVERANKEVIRHLKTLVYNRKVKSKWATYLPLVQRIMNASVHTTLGVSPAQLVFGNAVRLDRNLLPEIPLQIRHSEQAVNVYLNDLLETQKEIVQIALRNQLQTDQFNIANRGGNKPITEFPINSYVLVNYEGKDHKPPSKLHTFLRGPLRIVNRNGPIYTLENLVKNKLEDFHIKLLHPFKFDEAKVDPKEVAQHDEDHFGIVQVLNHRFTSNRQNRQDLEFLIEFDDDSEPIWQPWSADIRDNEQIHAYLTRNHMRKFIPIKYTYPRDHPLYEKPEPRSTGAPNSRKKKRKFGRY